MLDQFKEIELLKNRLSKLESKFSEKNSSISSFGRSYSKVGSSDSDFLIKTKGQVKIQWGNKFIDLIKDGKINVDANFIHRQATVGTKDGIYIIGNEDEEQVILQVGGSSIVLRDSGTTYISFQVQQETTSDQKYTALSNIGFIYKDLEQVSYNGLKNGIIYIESEQKLYVVQNGNVSEFTADISGKINKQLIIQKSDDSTGSLVIVGRGVENSLYFDSFYIYSGSNGEMVLDSNGEMLFKIYGQEKIRINNDAVIFSTDVISSMFKSSGASKTYGFRLYFDGKESTIEVDNVIARNSSENVSSEMYPYVWYYRNNIIRKVEEIEESSQNAFTLELLYNNEFNVGDTLYTYIPVIPENEEHYQNFLLPLKVDEVYIDNNLTQIDVSVISELIDQEEFISLDYDQILKQMQGQTIFLISIDGQSLTLLRKEKNNIDLVEVRDPQDAMSDPILRIGNIGELGKAGKKDGMEIPIEGYGVYSINAAYKEAQYTSDYTLPIEDNSTKFASTEWVNKLLPYGSIIMYNGLNSGIPEGWGICDGTNGTPNLIDKFIKAGVESGIEGGEDTIKVSIENLPAHTHQLYTGSDTTSNYGISGTQYNTIESSLAIPLETTETGEGEPLKWEPKYYSLIFIMKLS